MTVSSKDVVLGTYPEAIVREIQSPSGSYFMIYNMGAIAPDLIGFSMNSEDEAWHMASTRICDRMMVKLEKLENDTKSDD